MLASDLTVDDVDKFVLLGEETYGLIVLCSHNDPAIELIDGNVYHMVPTESVKFVSERDAAIGAVSAMLKSLGDNE